MDIDTTSINELPTISNIPPTQTTEEIMEQRPMNNANIVLDRETIPQTQLREKQVRFQDDYTSSTNYNKKNITPENVVNNANETSKYEISYDLKIVLVASILMFLFLDPKVKKYLLNVLVQVFGNFLKTEHGNMSQLGIVVYSLFYGATLYSILKSIDISSFHLAL